MAPSDGWFKLNVDGAARLELGEGGGGAVLRGGAGIFRAAGVWRFQGIDSVKQAEFLVIRVGLQLAFRAGCWLVQVETDSLEAVEACKGGSVDYSSLGFILSDIWELLAKFVECSIKYIPR